MLRPFRCVGPSGRLLFAGSRGALCARRAWLSAIEAALESGVSLCYLDKVRHEDLIRDFRWHDVAGMWTATSGSKSDTREASSRGNLKGRRRDEYPGRVPHLICTAFNPDGLRFWILE